MRVRRDVTVGGLRVQPTLCRFLSHPLREPWNHLARPWKRVRELLVKRARFQRSPQTSMPCRFPRAERRFPVASFLQFVCGLRYRWKQHTNEQRFPCHRSPGWNEPETSGNFHRTYATATPTRTKTLWGRHVQNNLGPAFVHLDEGRPRDEASAATLQD